MSPPTAPRSICLLRLSALGDASHVVPLVRTLRRAWPEVPITWIIGKAEAKLLEGLDDIEFLIFDKNAGLAGLRELRRQLAGRRFEVLLQMQLALRATLRRRSWAGNVSAQRSGDRRRQSQRLSRSDVARQGVASLTYSDDDERFLRSLAVALDDDLPG